MEPISERLAPSGLIGVSIEPERKPGPVNNWVESNCNSIYEMCKIYTTYPTYPTLLCVSASSALLPVRASPLPAHRIVKLVTLYYMCMQTIV